MKDIDKDFLQTIQDIIQDKERENIEALSDEEVQKAIREVIRKCNENQEDFSVCHFEVPSRYYCAIVGDEVYAMPYDALPKTFAIDHETQEPFYECDGEELTFDEIFEKKSVEISKTDLPLREWLYILMNISEYQG